MTEVLGYGRYGAQGGDWGSFITARLGLAYPDRLSGIGGGALSGKHLTHIDRIGAYAAGERPRAG